MIETTMSSPLSPSGGGQVKSGGELESPFTSSGEGKPGLSSSVSGAVNDRNKAPFDKPRASGGVPVKFFEDISVSPATLESTLENAGLVR